MERFLKNEVFIELRGRLAQIVDDDIGAKAIIRQAKLNGLNINLHGNPLMMMDALLSQADIEGKVIEVIEAAKANYGGDAALENIEEKIQTGIVLEGTIELNKDLSEEKICVLLFIYHDNDLAKCIDLKKQFRIFEINGEVIIKDFQNDITSGDIPLQRQQLVSNADIIMPIISAEFFDPKNSFLQLIRSAISVKKVVPVLLDHCLYSRVKVLEGYLTLPPLGRFISDYNNKEMGYAAVANGVQQLINNFPKNKS